MSWLKNKIAIKKLAVVSLDGYDWQLYPNEEMDNVARDLNATFERSVAAGNNRFGVMRDMKPVMRAHAKSGADDSEPRSVLDDLLDEVFGEE